MRFSPPSRWGVVESERSDLLENDLLFFGEKTSQRLNVPFTHLNVMSYDPNSLKSRVLFVTSNFLLKELIGLYIYIYLTHQWYLLECPKNAKKQVQFLEVQ